MTDFDHELIAALAEGTLPADEAADLEARVAADPAARAELEAQRVALAAIAAATPPQLDDLERRRLHRSVAAELDLVLPERAAPARRRWSVNWSALATAAAVLLGVALAAPLLSLLNTSDSASDTTLTVADAGDADERSLAQEAPPATEPPAADFEAAGVPETAVAEAASEAPPETTMVATTTAALLADDATGFGPVFQFGPLDDDLAEARARLERFADVDREAGEETPEPQPCVEEVQTALVADGAAAATTVSLLGTGTIADRPVYVLVVAEDDEVRQLVAVDADDCTTVATAVIE